MEQNCLKGLLFHRLCGVGTYCNSITMTVQNCGSDLWPRSAGSKKEASRVKAPDLTLAQGSSECSGHLLALHTWFHRRT